MSSISVTKIVKCLHKEYKYLKMALQVYKIYVILDLIFIMLQPFL